MCGARNSNVFGLLIRRIDCNDWVARELFGKIEAARVHTRHATLYFQLKPRRRRPYEEVGQAASKRPLLGRALCERVGTTCYMKS